MNNASNYAERRIPDPWTPKLPQTLE